jgi:alcohol dehydrogenase
VTGTYAVGFECSGRDAAFELLQERLRSGGRLAVISDGNLEPLVLSPHFHEKELLVVGSSDGLDYREHAQWFFDVAGGGSSGLERLFELRVAAEELPETFRRLAAGEVSPIKVLVRY